MLRGAGVLLAVLAGSAVLTSCGGSGPAAAAWVDLPPDVQLTSAEALVPEGALPTGVVVTQIVPPEDAEDLPGGFVETELQRRSQTIYADPSEDDPLDGRVVLIGRTDVEDVLGTPIRDGDPAPSLGTEGRVMQAGRGWAATWLVDPGDVECGCSQSAVVAGLGFTKEEVLDLARKARPQQLRPSLPAAALPDGLRSLGTLPAMAQDVATTAARSFLVADVNGRHVEVIGYAGDQRLMAHQAIWAALEGTGWDGPSHVVEIAGQAVVVRERDARAGAPLGPATQELLDSLAPVGPARAEAAAKVALERPSSAADSCPLEGVPRDESTYLAGTVDGVRWVMGFARRETAADTCVALIESDRSEPSASAGTLTFDAFDAGSMGLVGGSNHVLDRGRRITTVGGFAPAESAKVVVTVGGIDREARISDGGPTADLRWFAVAVAEQAPHGTSAVAYDGAGKEIGYSP